MRHRWLTGLVVLALGATSAHAELDPVFAPFREATDEAVNKGLDYLSEKQTHEGFFLGQRGRTTGVVALAGMAYLSQGHTPGQGPYGENINRCVDYLLGAQRADGMLVRNAGEGRMYSHSIATLFLSEVSGMITTERQEKLAEVLPPAVRLILKAQDARKNEERHKGGWRYQPDAKDSDLSCSGWALMALRSVKLNGAPVPDEAIDRAVEYIYRNHDERAGKFGYQNASSHSLTLTGMALLCLELCGQHGEPATFKAGDYVLKSMTQLPSQDFATYGNYYNAQGCFQLGGDYWQSYAEWMYGHFLKEQKEDGSWEGRREGTLYNTCMVVLGLSVPYRQLPIYQRDETVGEEGGASGDE